jgi:chromosome segregation ATPase
MSDRLFHIFFASRASEINALTAELSSLREQLSSHLASINRLTEERDYARADAAEARRSENVTLQKLLSAERADHYRTDPFGYAPVTPDPEKKILPQIEHAREARRKRIEELNANLVPVNMWDDKAVEKFLRAGRPQSPSSNGESPSNVPSSQKEDV